MLRRCTARTTTFSRAGRSGHFTDPAGASCAPTNTGRPPSGTPAPAPTLARFTRGSSSGQRHRPGGLLGGLHLVIEALQDGQLVGKPLPVPRDHGDVKLLRLGPRHAERLVLDEDRVVQVEYLHADLYLQQSQACSSVDQSTWLRTTGSWVQIPTKPFCFTYLELRHVVMRDHSGLDDARHRAAFMKSIERSAHSGQRRRKARSA